MKSSRLWFWVMAGLLLLQVAAPGQAGAATVTNANRVIIFPRPGDTPEQFQKEGAARIQNYGSYWLAEADDAHVKSLQKTHKNSVHLANRFNSIELSEATIDVTQGEPVLPEYLKEHNLGAKVLRLVQFKGPVKTEWLAQLKAINKLRVVNYVPNNAYLVSVDRSSIPQLQDLMATNGPAQWVGAYHPYYKLPKCLRNTTGAVDVDIGLLVDEGTVATLAAVERYALAPVQSHGSAARQLLVRMRVSAGDLPALAQLPGVVWLEQVVPVKPQDEVQCLVMAARTNAGGGPIYPVDSYIDFLGTTVGISPFPSDYPVLDICDTGVDGPNPNCGVCGGAASSGITWHPDFMSFSPAVSPNVSECAYFGPIPLKTYDFVGEDTVGHGTLVASVAVGADLSPDEIINCYTQKFSTNDVTNIVFVADCNTNQVVTCLDGVCTTNFVVASCVETSVNVVISCAVQEDVVIPQPWYLSRVDESGFQLGLGILPVGPFGASSMFEAETNAEDVVLNVYLEGLARLSNNSWGEGLVVGVNDGLYGQRSQTYDALTRDVVTTTVTSPGSPSPKNQEMLFVFSGGDANGSSALGGFGDVLTTPPATAKNVIAVGSTNLRLSGSAGILDFDPVENTTAISQFSSFGPTKDLRFKPDVVAPGEGITGATSQYSYLHSLCGACDPNDPSPFACEKGFTLSSVISELYNEVPSDEPGYAVYEGTSFSAPAVSGAAQLLYWYISNRLSMLPPSPALLKAYIMNSARYLPITNPLTGAMDKLPSIAQGMGMVDLRRMFDTVPRVIRDESTPRAIDPGVYATNVVAQQTYFSAVGQAYELSGQIADATEPFSVTLVWTDPPGTPGNGPQLVNDLDLQVTIGGQTYYGNNFGTQYSSAVNPLPDTINNVQTVILPAGTTGTWSVVVRAITLGGSVPNVGGGSLGQDYALVVYNGMNPSDIPNPATNDSCQTAATIALASNTTNNLASFTWTNNLAAGVYHNDMPSPTAGPGGDEEFFSISYPTPGTVFNVNTIGSNFGLKGTILSVWKGECGSLVEVTSNRNPTNSNNAAVTWTVDDINVYYVVAEGFQDAHGKLVLNVTATPPPFGFNTGLVDFGTNYVGLTSSQSVILKNATGSAATISSITIGGADPQDFAEFDNCVGTYLPSGGSCEITLSFSPTATGVRNGTLIVNDNITGSPHTLPLTGFGLAEQPVYCTNSTTSLTFGTLGIGLTGAVQTVVITNCGSADMIVSNETVSGAASNDFLIVSDSCLLSPIAPGGFCSVGVAFSPTAAGSRLATLVISDNTTTSPHNITLAGTGKVRAPIACITPLSLTLGNVTLATTGTPVSVTVSNCGDADLIITNVSIDGANASQFYVASDPCADIPSGGACVISVGFAPTVLGNDTANLVIADNAADSPQSIPLSGVGSGSQPDLAISKSTNLKKFIGLHIISPPTSIALESLYQHGGRNQKRVFYILMQNEGNVADSFNIQSVVLQGASVSNNEVTINYFLGSQKNNDVNITSAVTGSGFVSDSLAPGAFTGDATMIRVEITPSKTVPKSKSKPAVITTNSVMITATSVLDPSKSDSVIAGVYFK